MFKNCPKCPENIQRVTEHPFLHLVKKYGHIIITALSMTKYAKKSLFFCNFSVFLGPNRRFLYYTPQLQNTRKSSKMIQKCRENIQRVTEHPRFHLVKKSWSYHEHRTFYDKTCKKIHFFCILHDFEALFLLKIQVFTLYTPISKYRKLLKNDQKMSEKHSESD